jgi:hypothetical protein
MKIANQTQKINQQPRYKWAWTFHDRLPGSLDRWWQWIGCKLLGHVPIPDHCNIPEHDYCAWCQLPMPGMGRRSVEEGDGE